ncbi:MAG: three-Cys-motif partner protein TcmP [Gammaproteobacteria bacterium]|nr:three-Cys-motif partner protein TcmP [Gammaproteobacteria bacterium]
MLFDWPPGRDPPQIQPHSKAKLVVLRNYLRAYFDRLNVGLGQDRFKLDLVDGFAGGGTFLDDGDTLISGTPLIMLEELAAARERLNAKRTKPLQFDCKCYFVDVNKDHADHLSKVLVERGYDPVGNDIVVRTGRFADEVDGIVADIRRRQPRSGRAIFLLDQTGFSQVELDLVGRILRDLRNAEVILTFAADVLINYLDNDPERVRGIAPLQLSVPDIRSLLADRDGAGGRAVVQRTLRDHIRHITRATYDTPFFIRPLKSRRALWLLHLSRHPTARDVMMQCHWATNNTFEHYGPGDFGMLGWDALQEPASLPLFNFAAMDAERMIAGLLDTMAQEVFDLASDGPVAIEGVRHALANRTAARFSDLDQVILQLFREKEFAILTPDGKERSRVLQHLRSKDLVSFPSTLLLPSFSRVHRP